MMGIIHMCLVGEIGVKSPWDESGVKSSWDESGVKYVIGVN